MYNIHICMHHTLKHTPPKQFYIHTHTYRKLRVYTQFGPPNPGHKYSRRIAMRLLRQNDTNCDRHTYIHIQRALFSMFVCICYIYEYMGKVFSYKNVNTAPQKLLEHTHTYTRAQIGDGWDNDNMMTTTTRNKPIVSHLSAGREWSFSIQCGAQ